MRSQVPHKKGNRIIRKEKKNISWPARVVESARSWEAVLHRTLCTGETRSKYLWQHHTFGNIKTYEDTIKYNKLHFLRYTSIYQDLWSSNHLSEPISETHQYPYTENRGLWITAMELSDNYVLFIPQLLLCTIHYVLKAMGMQCYKKNLYAIVYKTTIKMLFYHDY